MSEVEKKEEVLEDETQEIEVEVEGGDDDGEEQNIPLAAEKQEATDEHQEYSDNVKKRIDRLTFKMREAERREEEALAFAKKVKEENDNLKTNYEKASSSLITESDNRVKSQLAEAKRALKLAYEEGDSEAMANAQELVAKLSVENDRITREVARLETKAETVVEEPSRPAPATQQPAAKPDPRAQKWAEENEWFGKDEVMTFTAFSIHRTLIEEEGYDPSSEDYYDEIDNRLRKELPHKFGEVKSGGARRPAQTVAPATRNVKSGRKSVRLNARQVAIAKKLGVPLEEYAKHVKEA
jgi:hypothetical protein